MGIRSLEFIHWILPSIDSVGDLPQMHPGHRISCSIWWHCSLGKSRYSWSTLRSSCMWVDIVFLPSIYMISWSDDHKGVGSDRSIVPLLNQSKGITWLSILRCSLSKIKNPCIKEKIDFYLILPSVVAINIWNIAIKLKVVYSLAVWQSETTPPFTVTHCVDLAIKSVAQKH